jgi:iron-sulfur cluster repair protein YtfE (RIC family)
MAARSEGWDAFAKFLRMHHDAEDDALWPVLEAELFGERDDVALLDDMKAEHAALDPLLETIESALDRGDPAQAARADLDTRLREHLTHEEESAFPLIDRTLSEEQWMGYGQVAQERLRPDMPTFLAWLLHDSDRKDAVLGLLPEPAQRSYEQDWQPAYAAKDWWAT